MKKKYDLDLFGFNFEKSRRQLRAQRHVHNLREIVNFKTKLLTIV